MQLKPLPPYFIVKINKTEQKERREKMGRFYLDPGHVFMTREVQYGEVVSIGEDAKDTFPQVEVGDILLLHHFVTGKEAEGTDENRYHIHTEGDFNYYTVSCFSQNGRGVECYGVYKNGGIIPHPEYILLEGDKPKDPASVDEFVDKKFEKKGSLFLAKKWEESREDMGKKMKDLKHQSQELAKTTVHDEQGNEVIPDEVKWAIEDRENEMNRISNKVNKKECVPFKVEFTSSVLSEEFGETIKNGDIVYCLNQACNTQIEFKGVNYRVVKINYVYCTKRWLLKSMKQYADFNKELVL